MKSGVCVEGIRVEMSVAVSAAAPDASGEHVRSGPGNLCVHFVDWCLSVVSLRAHSTVHSRVRTSSPNLAEGRADTETLELLLHLSDCEQNSKSEQQ